MTQSSMTYPKTSHDSYVDYVSLNYDNSSDSIRWLVKFLGNRFTAYDLWQKPRHQSKQDMEIDVIDSVNDILESYEFTVPEHGEVG